MNITTEWTDKDWDKFTVWLKGMLTVSEGIVTFTKSDGSERVMKCTLNPYHLPKVEIKEEPRAPATAVAESIKIEFPITVGTLAKRLNMRAAEVIKALMGPLFLY